MSDSKLQQDVHTLVAEVTSVLNNLHALAADVRNEDDKYLTILKKLHPRIIARTIEGNANLLSNTLNTVLGWELMIEMMDCEYKYRKYREENKQVLADRDTGDENDA